MTPPDSGRRTLLRELGSATKAVALPAVLLTGVMMLLGLLVTHVLQHGWLGHEAALNRSLAAHRTSGLNTATHVITWVAETPTIIGLTAAAAVVFRLVFRRWHESVYVVFCVAGETVIFVVTSIVIDRRRPPVPHLDDAPPTSSFPSGHTAASVAFYGAVAMVIAWHNRHALVRVIAVTLAIAVALVVGASRLYRGMHFVSDVAGGLLLGVTWLTLTTRLMLVRDADRGYRPNNAERRRPRSPAAPRREPAQAQRRGAERAAEASK